MEHGADFGIAFDGDGDRLAMADHDGRLFDGDQLLYAIAKHRHEIGRLRGGVAGTLMTNFALERRLGELGIPFARAKVGDRYVLELLHEKGWECGGENSGHILCLDCHSTGDAIISALQVLEALVAAGQTLGDFTRDLTLLPQVLTNVRLGEPGRRDRDARGAGGGRGGGVGPGGPRPRAAAPVGHGAGDPRDGGGRGPGAGARRSPSRSPRPSARRPEKAPSPRPALSWACHMGSL